MLCLWGKGVGLAAVLFSLVGGSDKLSLAAGEEYRLGGKGREISPGFEAWWLEWVCKE